MDVLGREVWGFGTLLGPEKTPGGCFFWSPPVWMV
jgi:hypothetical protein